MSRHPTKCDDCKLPKTPIIYIRTSKKVCMECWQALKNTNKSLISSLPSVADSEAPLGYHFVINDWFSDEAQGRRYADHVYSYLTSSLA